MMRCTLTCVHTHKDTPVNHLAYADSVLMNKNIIYLWNRTERDSYCDETLAKNIKKHENSSSQQLVQDASLP